MKRSSNWIAGVSLVPVLAACLGPESNPESNATPDASTVPEPVAAVVVDNAAVGRPVTASCPPNSLYPADGVKSLVDGKLGFDYYEDSAWMGWWYEDKPLEATIDLGQTVSIRELAVHALTASEVWIFYPRKVEFELSDDGKTFRKLTPVKPSKEELETEDPNERMFELKGLTERARYVRVKAQRYGELPDWHAGHGGGDGYDGQAWLFVDEIVVMTR